MAPNDKAGSGKGAIGGDRDKSLEIALAQIERQFGRGAIMRLGDDTRTAVEVIPTGAISLDVALGIGGFPRGRIVEVYGPESSGKTSIAPERISMSAISSACSPVSGCDTSSASMSTPSFLA